MYEASMNTLVRVLFWKYAPVSLGYILYSGVVLLGHGVDLCLTLPGRLVIL